MVAIRGVAHFSIPVSDVAIQRVEPGKIHVGLNNYTGGRAGDPAAVSLSARLKELKDKAADLQT